MQFAIKVHWYLSKPICQKIPQKFCYAGLEENCMHNTCSVP